MKPSFVLCQVLLAACAPAFAAEPVLDRLARTGELRACIWPDYYGVTFRNPATQELTGVDVDMARAFAAELKVRLRFVDTSLASTGADLATERCDIAMFALAVQTAETQPLRMSRGYLQSDIYAVAHKGSAAVRSWQDIDRPGMIVAIPSGSFLEKAAIPWFRHARVTAVPASEREREVRSGRADVFLTNFTYSQRVVQQADWARLLAPPTPLHLTTYAYATRPGDDAWGARVDAFVDRVRRDGTLKASARRNRLEPWLLQP